MKKAFTLIELLVVIAIIGILAAIVITNMASARMRARDAKRKADMDSMVTALNMYYEVNQRYPVGGWYADCWRPTDNWIADSTNYNWSTGFLNQQPHDPVDECVWPFTSSANRTATYAYWSDTGQRFAIVTRLEDANDRSTIQNANTRWFDGNSLYTTHGWYARSYVILQGQ